MYLIRFILYLRFQLYFCHVACTVHVGPGIIAYYIIKLIPIQVFRWHKIILFANLKAITYRCNNYTEELHK